MMSVNRASQLNLGQFPPSLRATSAPRKARCSTRIARRSRRCSMRIFGDPVAVAAMVDRLVHHAEVLVLRGDSYRLISASFLGLLPVVDPLEL